MLESILCARCSTPCSVNQSFCSFCGAAVPISRIGSDKAGNNAKPPNTEASGSAKLVLPPPTPKNQGVQIGTASQPLNRSPNNYEQVEPVQPTPFIHDYERRLVAGWKKAEPFYSSPALQTPLHLQTPLQQYKDYVKFRIQYSSEKASRLRFIHNTLQTIILVGAALVSISLGFPYTPSWFPPLISGAVTIATAITSYYKFGDRSRDLYRSAEDMQREYNWFKLKRGPYKNIDEKEAFDLLQDKIDILKREQFTRTFAFEEQKEEKK